MRFELKTLNFNVIMHLYKESCCAWLALNFLCASNNQSDIRCLSVELRQYIGVFWSKVKYLLNRTSKCSVMLG